jgi:hypothetical protein
MEDCMAKKSVGFNLSAVIREYRKAHPAVSANDALEALKKAHSGLALTLFASVSPLLSTVH